MKNKKWPYIEMANCTPVLLITALNNTFCHGNFTETLVAVLASYKPGTRYVFPNLGETNLLQYC